MKRLFVAALFCSTSFSPVFAEDISLKSVVSAVTVFPQGAEVSRVVKSVLPSGEHVLIVKDLPGQIVPNSVRVEGVSTGDIEIGSVDVRQEYISRSASPVERKAIEDKIEVLNDEIAALSQSIQNANSQRKLIQAIATRAIAPRKNDNGEISIDAAQIDALLNVTEKRLAGLSQVIGKANIEIRKRHRSVSELVQKLGEQSPQQRLQTIVSINLNATTAGDATFKIRYNVQDAGWVPVYDAKLTIGAKGKDSSIKLARRASVSQGTSDIWKDVALTLSTARPSGRTAAPGVSPYILREQPKFAPPAKTKRYYKKERVRKPVDALVQSEADAVQSAPSPAPRPVRRVRTQVVFAGFLAEYKIAGKVTVSNKNAVKNVIIGTDDMKVDLAAHATPRRDVKAYLTAKFKVASKSPYLPGQVLLFRDGVFLGKGRLPRLNTGQEHVLSFGSDEFIRIKRSKVKQKISESGLFSKSRIEVRNWVTTVQNLHDFAMPVVISDRLPTSTHEDIEVKLVAGSTPASRTNVKKMRGVLAWDLDVAPNETKTINFGYQVTWPKGMAITPIR